ncbi:hypothetical protein SASPL_104448 [Salvia splendens]|uniref:Uncharacterized protein n=1 Tax=Salvia splendens TaxID=180675 RepID=A0A8X8YMU1_SALSN|nr:hypothetical protein SASPL_104448 [Salvia splendens]
MGESSFQITCCEIGQFKGPSFIHLPTPATITLPLPPIATQPLFFSLLAQGVITLVIFFSAVTRVLDELDHTIQKVKVTTTPDGCSLDLFFIKDNL